ncbi:hypothetical protein [Mangrovicoccus sp. HB161399]|uniref:hypothetical protein n=1 Tax=Mangrovicoccus sp. HB161399 TaxID=2720392 RepID=UPI001557CD13|nr:hypothetical protein [Mangrovicoccus sp. HB161399]
MRFSLHSAFLLPALLAGLAGCDPAALTALNSATPDQVPEAVRAAAAPDQDIATARVLPEDGCYWYEYSGPVETTLLPLLTPGGRPICTQAAVEAKAADAG